MGRHRGAFRDLGWGVSNSPNPWKQGSAKRVVRALDLSNVQDAEPPAAESASDAFASGRENDGRQDGACAAAMAPRASRPPGRVRSHGSRRPGRSLRRPSARLDP